MEISAPTLLAHQPTIALGTPLGRVFSHARVAGRVPVYLHALGGEKARAHTGPRELLAATRAALVQAGHIGAWGAGAVVSATEDAAAFAIAGCTWFTLDLARRVDGRGDTFSLDELDAALVALEDAGAFTPGWHDAYLDRSFAISPTLTLALSDEVLARAAVKFAPALAHAEQLQQAIRTCWAGHGELPDMEVRIATDGRATTREEFFFLAQEVRHRGLGVQTLTPNLGPMWEPARADVAAHDFTDFAAIAAHCGMKLGLAWSDGKTADAGHLDVSEAAPLELLRQLAERDPLLFHEWLREAQLAFPLDRAGWPISTTEDDARMMPQVADDALAETFLGSTQGRQVLLVTFASVAEMPLGERCAKAVFHL